MTLKMFILLEYEPQEKLNSNSIWVHIHLLIKVIFSILNPYYLLFSSLKLSI